MADDQFGDAGPIADVGRGIYKKANSLYHLVTGSDISTDATTPAGQKPADTTWHDDMVKKAQAAKAAQDADAQKSQQIPTQTKAQKRPAVSAKIQIKSSVKPGPQKAVGGK
jgi:hypothetical protein